jgi:DNA-binding GntR family transcriptional regulator
LSSQRDPQPPTSARWKARCSGSRWLLSFCEQLADQHHRYRRLSAPRAFSKRGVKSEHQALMEAAIAGHADEAVALLRAHFERTARIIRDDPGLFEPRAA